MDFIRITSRKLISSLNDNQDKTLLFLPYTLLYYTPLRKYVL